LPNTGKQTSDLATNTISKAAIPPAVVAIAPWVGKGIYDVAIIIADYFIKKALAGPPLKVPGPPSLEVGSYYCLTDLCLQYLWLLRDHLGSYQHEGGS